MPRPTWTFIKLDSNLPDNERWGATPLGTQLYAEATFARAIMYAWRGRTDGFISHRRWARIGNAKGRRTLIGLGFVLETTEGIHIPHYLDVYPSRAQIEALSEKRRKAGIAGQLAKQHADRQGQQHAQQHAGRQTGPQKKKKITPPTPPPSQNDVEPASPEAVHLIADGIRQKLTGAGTGAPAQPDPGPPPDSQPPDQIPF